MTPPRHVAVIGAGAAGLTAAISAAVSGARVTLLNAHPRIGLKILMSGGTRCNVTHREVSERDYHGGSRHFVARVLRAFTVEQTLAWFAELGVELKLEETGKYFPATNDANTVLEALLAACARTGVTIESGARVVRIAREGEGYRLGIQTVRSAAAFGAQVTRPGGDQWSLPAVNPDRWLEAEAVILATGGLSFPRSGSDGVGYALVTALGHTLEPPIPALTPLASDDSLCAAAQGITLVVELTLSVAAKRVEKVSGSMVIAHFGYSGPAALDLSRHWLRAIGERRVTASFAPAETTESFRAAWVDAAQQAPERTVRRHLARWLPERLGERLAEESGVDPSWRVNQVKRDRRDMLIAHVLERDLHVVGTLGYEKAEVTAGGVRLSEVDPSTLESRKAPGLQASADDRTGADWAWENCVGSDR